MRERALRALNLCTRIMQSPARVVCLVMAAFAILITLLLVIALQRSNQPHTINNVRLHNNKQSVAGWRCTR